MLFRGRKFSFKFGVSRDIQHLKIGTRGSPLALWQAREVEARLKAAHPGLSTELVVIKTSGDWKPEDGEVRLSEVEGGKGQFAKEIEQALLAGAIDIAVHSMKDMDSFLPKGLVINHMLPREDARDAFLSANYSSIDDLPKAAVVGTASVRRQAFLLSRRPDLKIVPLRGNVQTRIDKLKEGQVDATFLACAGLKRLGLEDEITSVLSYEEMLPAAGQGAVGIEMREKDFSVAQLLETINCRTTLLCVGVERAILKILDGSCHTPIGAYARFEGKELVVDAHVCSLDGQKRYTACSKVPLEFNDKIDVLATSASIGEALGQQLKEQLPDGFLQ